MQAKNKLYYVTAFTWTHVLYMNIEFSSVTFACTKVSKTSELVMQHTTSVPFMTRVTFAGGWAAGSFLNSVLQLA